MKRKDNIALKNFSLTLCLALNNVVCKEWFLIVFKLSAHCQNDI